jgi:rRNA maturation RNase YbeY
MIPEENGIHIYWDEVAELPLAQENIEITIARILKDHQHSLNYINIIFCSDETLLQMNIDHLDHDYYTDIITFPIEAEPLAAELYISIERVADNAKQLKTAPDQELLRVIYHGVLHLVGYDDHEETDIAAIRAKENEYLSFHDSLS